MDNTLKDKLTQIRLNALQAIYLHQKRIYSLKRQNQFVEFLAISVPVFYFVPRYLLKGTEHAKAVEVSWEILAAILLVTVIFQLVFKWKENEIEHSTMAHRNRDIAREALKLFEKENINSDALEEFNKRVQEYDTLDNDKLLNGTKKEDDQESFRHALKNLIPNATHVCPKCQADPWKFEKGNCELCGNKPLTN